MTRPDPVAPEAAIHSSAALVTTLVTTDYTSPSLTGWYADAGVSSMACLFFRATDSSALLRAEYDCQRGKQKSR
jgi:hypothetical protein